MGLRHPVVRCYAKDIYAKDLSTIYMSHMLLQEIYQRLLNMCDKRTLDVPTHKHV